MRLEKNDIAKKNMKNSHISNTPQSYSGFKVFNFLSDFHI